MCRFFGDSPSPETNPPTPIEKISRLRSRSHRRFYMFGDTLRRKKLAVSMMGKRYDHYRDESTGSRLITEVKHRRARIVLGWVTSLFCKMTMEFIGIF